MEKFTWTAIIKEGKKAEYVKRHDEIWPEMVKVLKDAGISNYTIWADGNRLFGYYECENIEFATKTQAESPVVAKWNVYMNDVMDIVRDENTGFQPSLEKVFTLD